jgi:hypothetical protein
MKNIAIALIASFGIATAFAQAAKQPEGIAKTTPVAAPTGSQNKVEAPAPAKAEAPKTEMKLAKKKEDKAAPKADATKSAPAKDEKAATATAPKADAKPAGK